MHNVEFDYSFLNFLQNKTILITGSTGLIGSFLIEKIIEFNERHEEKIRVIAVNRNINKAKERFSFLDTKDIIFLGNGAENITLEQLPGGINYIVHAGSNADPMNFALHPVETITANVIGTNSLLEIAKEKKARFLLVSTREVYGFIKDGVAYSEDDYGLCNFNTIRSSYPESKRVAELLCNSFHDEYGVNTVITRLGYVYGETQVSSDSRVIAQFIRKAVSGENIELKSEGLQKRSYTYVSDCITALLLVLHKGSDLVYNIADESSSITLFDLAHLVARLAGTEVIKTNQTDVEAKGSSFSQDALLDCKKLRSLGWSPKVSLEAGILKSIDRIKK